MRRLLVRLLGAVALVYVALLVVDLMARPPAKTRVPVGCIAAEWATCA